MWLARVRSGLRVPLNAGATAAGMGVAAVVVGMAGETAVEAVVVVADATGIAIVATKASATA